MNLVTTQRRRSPKWLRSRKGRKVLTAYLFILPVVVGFLLFRIYPAVLALAMSFFEWNPLVAERPFVGIQNYVAQASDPVFWTALRNTFLVIVLLVPVGAALALGFALLLSGRLPLTELFKTIYFMPVVTSLVAVSMVWQWLLQPQFGLLNIVLKMVGIPGLGWLDDPNTALISVVIVLLWVNVGYFMIIYIAGIKQIPREYYEAALIDGASGFQRLWHLTLPLLKSTILFVLVIGTINSSQVFTPVFVMTQGGPINSTRVLVLHIYERAFKVLNFGEASAAAMVLFVMVLSFSVIQMYLLRRGE